MTGKCSGHVDLYRRKPHSEVFTKTNRLFTASKHDPRVKARPTADQDPRHKSCATWPNYLPVWSLTLGSSLGPPISKFQAGKFDRVPGRKATRAGTPKVTPDLARQRTRGELQVEVLRLSWSLGLVVCLRSLGWSSWKYKCGKRCQSWCESWAICAADCRCWLKSKIHPNMFSRLLLSIQINTVCTYCVYYLYIHWSPTILFFALNLLMSPGGFSWAKRAARQLCTCHNRRHSKVCLALKLHWSLVKETDPWWVLQDAKHWQSN